MIARFPDATVTRLAFLGEEDERHVGAAYDSAGVLIAASQRWPGDPRQGCDPATLAEAMANGRGVERTLPAALYLGHAFTHFGHFLVETVPNLCWVREVAPDIPLLFHPFDRRGKNVFTELPYGIECLKLLGIPAQRVVMATSDCSVAELLLPPRAYDVRHGANYDFRDAYRALRVAALHGRSASDGGLVYLSRRKLTRRQQRIENESAVERHMRRRGFTVIYPERMSLAEQIRGVAEAAVVAGVDGSALHLGAFLRPGSRMLVLETRRRRNVHRLNALMDVETIAVRVAAAPSGTVRPSVDLAALDTALDRLGCPSERGLVRRLIDRLAG
jgi:capsular polysaccharide biosynthesis protein